MEDWHGDWNRHPDGTWKSDGCGPRSGVSFGAWHARETPGGGRDHRGFGGR